MRSLLTLCASVALVTACSGASAPAASTSQTPTASGAASEPASGTATADRTTPGAAAEPAFESGGMRCMYAPDGILLSCEQISVAGVGQPSAAENCAMLGSQLTPGECPTQERLAGCMAMDGPDLSPVYPIRISYYRSPEVPDASRAQTLCAELGGTSIP